MKYFEKYLRKKVINAETPLNTLDLWQAIEQKRKKRRRALFFYWTFGAVMGIALLGLGVMSWQKSNVSSDNITFYTDKNQVQNASQKQVTAQTEMNRETIAKATVATSVSTAINNESNTTITNEAPLNQAQKAVKSDAFAKKSSVAKVLNSNQSELEKQAKNSTPTFLVTNEISAKKENIYTENAINILPNKDEKTIENITKNTVQPKTQTTDNQIFNIEKIDFLPFLTAKEIVFETVKNNAPERVAVQLKQPVKKLNHEISLAFGAGFANRNALKTSDTDKNIGDINNVIVWASDLKYNHFLKKNHYISLGLQANQFVNLLTYNNTKKEVILEPDSLKRLAFNKTTGKVYIASDTLRITKEIDRQVLQYQYFSNLNLTFGIGKIWSKNRFRYQLGADFGLCILQKQKANYLDKNLTLQPFLTSQKVQSNVQIYTQIAYQFNRNTSIFSQIAYNQSFASLDGLAKYNTLFLKLGIGRRF